MVPQADNKMNRIAAGKKYLNDFINDRRIVVRFVMRIFLWKRRQACGGRWDGRGSWSDG